MALTPDRILALNAANDALQAAPHGSKSAIAAAQARLLGCDVKTLYRQINEAGFGAPRKRRSDAGQLSISKDAAMTMMAIKTAAQRANGKDNLSVGTAGEMTRANGLAALGKLDKSTGELVPVSDATLRRAIRAYRLDLKTLRAPAPHRGAKSLHPNHVWQIDASVCVLFYLDSGGLGVMEQDEFYKNKPENFQKKAKAMVIRYVCTDHYTGTVHFRYYLGAESGEMLCEFFIDCIQPKANEKDPFHGVPMIIVVDPGSANKGAMFQTLCRQLGVKVIVHRPKNPRAKGSVEKHNDLIERGFEGRLIALAVTSLEQLNAQADLWRRNFNGTRAHRRHGHTRYGFWQTIRAEQLRLAPAPEICRALLTDRTCVRKVNGDMTVQFDNRSFTVAHLEHLRVGQDVTVARNPYRPDAILVIEQDEHRRDVHYVCPEVLFDAAGFRGDAPTWGEDFKAFADTPAVKDMKAIEQLAYGVEGKLEVDAARRARKPVFGGLDITGYLDAATPASYMPRPGTEMDIKTPLSAGTVSSELARPAAVAVEARQLNLVQLASRLAGAMPGEWTPDHYQTLQAWYPAGALESEVAAIVDRLRGFTEPPRLRAVGGA
ncbi:MAG: DDE-type integrase/transposase/recombinase [Dechloromonas sp.]|nr:DDE-type integrase/transposase/recombinase [Dechloromonas sp.]